MKRFILYTIAPLFFGVTGFTQADDVVCITQPFGRGTITRRSDGSTTITQPFGRGTLARDTYRNSSRSGTRITQPFGRGSITRGTGDYYQYESRTKERWHR